MSRPTILVTAADLPDTALSLLADYQIVYAGRAPTEEEIVALVRRHDPVGIILRYGRLTEAVISAARRLKVISKFGSGTDTIDHQAAARHRVEVRAAIGVNAPSVAEHAIAMMLACVKSLNRLNDRMHQGHWDKAVHRSLELRGRTLGLVGLGAIGRRVAAIASAMEMQVQAHDPLVRQAPPGVRMTGLDDLLASSDVLSLHCPLTDQSRALLNAQTLARTKPGVIIVNTARGGLIDEPALLDAVRRGHVAWAALDCLAKEPPAPGHIFFGQPNFLLTPHIGGVSEEAFRNVGAVCAENLLAVLQG